MNCTGCGFDNRDEAHFCGDCGASLAAEIRCGSCGRISPAGRKFCDDCGRPFAAGVVPSPQTYTPKHLADKILRARSALEGERKQVTVFFADVKGSMELAEQVDPEEWHRILDRFFQILSEGVHRFEGTINQYTGDGVMALFGAPIAHEDHAQRACFAALYLRDALRRYADELRVASGLNFSVRMGLNSGEVVVGKIGDDLRMDYTAQGPTVGLAARMEQLAEPGKVLLTQHTAALVTGYFRLRDLGPARVKGVSGPLRIHELEGIGELRTRFDLSRQRGFSRFVGRADELSALDEALQRAVAGEFSVVGVVAEAGTGKSRLCHELVQACRARGIEVHQGHALPHGKLVPLLPLLELLRSIFGIGTGDSSDVARQKIAGRIYLLDPELQDKLPLWFDILGVPDPARPLTPLEPEVRQAQLIAGIRRLVRARSQNAPRLLMIEDLHWLDDASEAILAALVDVLRDSRTLLLLNFRPEYHAAWMERDGVPYRQIALRPLGVEAVNLLLDDLLGTAGGLADLRQLVRARTGGSPFFVEEVVRSLFDNGVLARDATGTAALARDIEEIEIPSTVQAVLAARIDRLPEAHKHVLQTAAVIGKTFSESMLRSALGAEAADEALTTGLEALVGADFLHVLTLAPQKEFSFRHPLTQEVAYRSQLGDRRAPVHAAVARAIEAAHAEQLDEQAALLAHHWAGAGELLRAAEWHRRAAEWLGMRDRREMMRHWRQVCETLSDVPESPEALALGVVARQRMLVNSVFVGMPRQEVGRLFDEGIALAARLPHLTPQISLRMSYGLTLFFGGAINESLVQMREVLHIADGSQDNHLRYIARVSMLGALVNCGELRECLQRNDEALEISGGDPDLGAEMTRFSPLGVLLANRAQALLYSGRNQEAWPALERAYEIGRARNDIELISMAHVFRSLARGAAGDAPGALFWARQAVEVAESVDSAQLRVGAYGTLGLAQSQSGLNDEAVEALSHSLDLMEQTGTGLFLEPGRLCDRADVWLNRGDLARARVDVERAIAIARERGAGLSLIQALTVRGRLLREEGHAAAAEATLAEAEALITQTGAISLQPAIHLERATLAERRGDAAERRRQLHAARAIFTAMGATLHVERIDSDLALPSAR